MNFTVVFIAISFFLVSFILSWFLYVYCLRRTGDGRGEKYVEGAIFCSSTALLNTLFGEKFYQTDIIFAVTCAVSVFFLNALSFCDQKSGYLPDELILLFFLLGLSGGTSGNFTYKLNAFLLCGAFFLCLSLVSACIFGKEGIGRGDVKLTACAGLFLGIYAGIAVVFGILFTALGMILKSILSPCAGNELPLGSEGESMFFPMAPSLTAGIVFAAFCGGDIITALLSPFVGGI